MARRGASTLSKILNSKFNWQESYAGLVLGAIIVIILGLLVANFLTKRTEQPETGDITSPVEGESKTPQEYKVVAGDSLSKISEANYGSQEYWPILAQINHIVNPNIIWVDSTLNIPIKDQLESLKEETMSTSYAVKEGDTLFEIAEKVYGDGSKWPILHRANGSRRLPNGNPLIFAGTTIVVPR